MERQSSSLEVSFGFSLCPGQASLPDGRAQETMLSPSTVMVGQSLPVAGSSPGPYLFGKGQPSRVWVGL